MCLETFRESSLSLRFQAFAFLRLFLFNSSHPSFMSSFVSSFPQSPRSLSPSWTSHSTFEPALVFLSLFFFPSPPPFHYLALCIFHFPICLWADIQMSELLPVKGGHEYYDFSIKQ